MPDALWVWLILLPQGLYACYLLGIALLCLLPTGRPIKNDHSADVVHVLVPMRNEAAHIAACLHSLIAQSNTPKDFEILIIDDHSEDDSADIVAQFQTSERIRLLHLPLKAQGKKAALAHGINHCPDDAIIITTDADCTHPHTWLHTLLQAYDAKTQAVCGPVRFTGGNVLQHWQRLELAGFMSLTHGHIRLGAPSLANGANFSFRKSAYNSVRGYRAPKAVASGDDMLLLHKIAKHFGGKSIAFAASRSPLVHTPAMRTLGRFWQQRLRWVSKASAYTSLPTVISQGLAYVANLWLVILLPLAYSKHISWEVFAIGYALKALGEISILSLGVLRYEHPLLLLWAPILQPIQSLYTVIVGPIAVLRKSYTWKGRQTK